MNDTISEELSRLPECLQYIPTVIEVQKDLGGSGKPAEVFDLVLDRIDKSKNSLIESASSNPSKFNNDMQRVKQTLVHAGLLDVAQKGVWTLTEKGLSAESSDIDLYHLNDIRKKAEKAYREKRKRKINGEVLKQGTTVGSKKPIRERDDYLRRLLNQLKTLSTADLVKVCHEILNKSGFERVSIIRQGREDCFKGDCTYEENPFMRFKVMFQFKCIQGLIGAEEIMDFRSAMRGRADKGIFMATCGFTMNAKLEARKEGVSQVVLVDGNKLVDMIKKLKIQL